MSRGYPTRQFPKPFVITRRAAIAGISAAWAAQAWTQTPYPEQSVRAGTPIAALPYFPHFQAESGATTAGIGNYITVSAGADNGANNCMASKMWQAARHSTTKQAVDNLLAKIPARIAVAGQGNCWIGGHGNEGLLETGCGQGSGDYKTQYVMTWNEAYWGPEFDRLKNKNFIMTYIFSCHTGAGDQGADVLWQLAKRTGRPAAGRTGFTYCGNSITFEGGSVWQVATPDARPTPIKAPTEHLTIMSRATTILIPQGGVLRPLEPADIRSVSIRRRGMDGRMGPSSNVSRSDQRYEILLSTLFVYGPARLPGDPTAMMTATVTIVTRGGTVTAEIYNDRLVRFEGTDIAYYAASDVAGMLSALTD